MEIGSVTKPAAVAASVTPPRAESLVSSGAVRTELAPEAAVQQVGDTEAVRFEPSEGARTRAALDAGLRQMIERNLTIDPKTREIVFQAIDEKTGEIVRQVPEEAILRLRIYAREMRDAEDEASREDGPRVEKIA